MPYLGIFGQDFQKNYCHIWNQHLQICVFAKFHEKTKCLNLGTKTPDLGIFGLEFENNSVIFEVSTLEQKCLNLGLKMPYLGIFGLEF